jgi:enterochelin esterase family protein
MGALLLSVLTAAHAQQAAPPRPAMPAFRTTPNDTLVSPEVLSDNRVTLRLYAPEAKSVKVRGEWVSDFVEAQKGTDLQADSSGVWSVTVGPVRPGIFRYSFLVDGAEVADPRNPDSSQSLNFTRGMVAVPGLEYQDLGEVPHGAIHIEWYRSKTLGTLRRLHVYTPPGYENGAGKYPVFYLLHGAGDTDDSWSTVGRAGFILDNLIAANRAKPMVVVMPAGHTTRQFTMGGGASSLSGQFEKDFTQDIVPYVESHYRVLTDRQHRAIAGLSMGGMHTLNLAFGNPEQFAYVGVFSSGWFAMGQNAADGPETRYAAALDDARAKQGLKLLWLATGKDDFVLETTRATVATLKRHGFQPEYQETAGSHTWENWRDYLRQFAPRLFQ